MEYCAALIQLYREEARYLERTAPWLERVGLEYLKARVVEDGEGRAELAERFRHSQRFSQDDPWAARAAGADREQAHYLERTAPWIERVGLEQIKTALFGDPDTVRQFAARFRYAQQFMQDDPWAKRVAGERRDLHAHLGEVRPLTLENA